MVVIDRQSSLSFIPENPVGLRTFAKRKILGLVFDSITNSVERHIERNPGCRLYQISEAVLPGDYGKRSRLFMSHVMDDLVTSGKVVKYKPQRIPYFYHATFTDGL